ncbi:guanylate-binding protein 1 isoform X2 [Amia ocellicauda]|uniref:guanylate-binding protein 1 isoform X2 n=1 Tax=Amia ocellicauda TaxID=2972642 RepID=UPI003464827E
MPAVPVLSKSPGEHKPSSHLLLLRSFLLWDLHRELTHNMMCTLLCGLLVPVLGSTVLHTASPPPTCPRGTGGESCEDQSELLHGGASAPIEEMESPVELVVNNEGKLSIKQEALKILSRIDRPVVVVAVAGPARSGKSYLMNRLAGRKKGFELGATVQSLTKGIWMWCLRHPTKPNNTLVLLDTEGFGDAEKGDEDNDHSIFTLAILLSSMFVYNSKGTITQHSLQDLLFVTELAQRIQMNTKSDGQEGAEFVSFFPGFVWTLRDLTLELNINGETVTADRYLEHTLMLKKGLGILVETYVEALNSGKRPCVESAVERLAHKENSAAVNQALEYYTREMSRSPVTEVLSIHNTEHFKKAVQIFLRHSMKDEQYTYLSKLMVALGDKYKALHHAVESKSEERCTSVLEELQSGLKEKLDSAHYIRAGGYEEFTADLEDIVRQYNIQVEGEVQAKKVLDRFFFDMKAYAKEIKKVDTIVQAKETEMSDFLKGQQEEAKEKTRRQEEKEKDEQMKRYEETIKQLNEKIEEISQMKSTKAREVQEKKTSEMEIYKKEGSKEDSERMRREREHFEEKEEKRRNSWYESFKEFAVWIYDWFFLH